MAATTQSLSFAVMVTPSQQKGPAGSQGGSRWPGLVFGGLGFGLFVLGLGLGADRIVVFLTWPEVEARVIESRIETSGNQHTAHIRVEFEVPGRRIVTMPDSDYRSGKYSWIAKAVDRFPVGSTATVRYHPSNPEKTRLEVGYNFNTFGTPLLLVGIGLAFWGVGALAERSARLERSTSNARNRVEAAQLVRTQYLGVAAFVGVIGLASLGAGVALLLPALAMRQWPAVIAQVERTDIFTRSTRAEKHSSVTYYVGRVYVMYELGGWNYKSTLVLRDSSTDRAKTERLLAAFRPGEPREVSVNPEDPYQIITDDSRPLVLPGVFLFVGLVITGVAVLVVRSVPKNDAKAV